MNVSYDTQTDKAIIRDLIIHPEDTNFFAYESGKRPDSTKRNDQSTIWRLTDNLRRSKIRICRVTAAIVVQ